MPHRRAAQQLPPNTRAQVWSFIEPLSIDPASFGSGAAQAY
ncbi:hypothetical protein AA0113_g11602 [Alternaria arborescens]|uniref:Uncharacterized protein n=1 Tax=Alternaria arborescens TaxID=156630 RepID=A0A4Q4Q6E9_9PLEO|nr:hypothetical protein AA0111_g10786 [Alternaria arborescens]RYN43080.1 hypothetical protein AA0112_g1108 [Alternaria arborescens]RYO18577.1 hypothetical protein AA0111_g10786 [Alternaria arborescens]RYO34622.1 hypothetical protein AA0113_g11602 [Alternaria arborescens]